MMYDNKHGSSVSRCETSYTKISYDGTELEGFFEEKKLFIRTNECLILKKLKGMHG